MAVKGQGICKMEKDLTVLAHKGQTLMHSTETGTDPKVWGKLCSMGMANIRGGSAWGEASFWKQFYCVLGQRPLLGLFCKKQDLLLVVYLEMEWQQTKKIWPSLLNQRSGTEWSHSGFVSSIKYRRLREVVEKHRDDWIRVKMTRMLAVAKRPPCSGRRWLLMHVSGRWFLRDGFLGRWHDCAEYFKTGWDGALLIWK